MLTVHYTAVYMMVKRRSNYYLLNVFAMTVALTLLSGLGFSCELESNGDRLSITLTLLLTSVAFKLVTSEMLPKVPYLTRLDVLMLSSMLTLFITSFLVVLPSGILLLWPEDTVTAMQVNGALAATVILSSITLAMLWLRSAQRADRQSKSRLIEEKQGQKWYYYAYAEPAFVKRQDEY